MIRQPEKQNYTEENICMIICGLPGVGKTTVASSAPSPVVFDADRGMKRVKPEHRCTASTTDTYEEFLEDIKSLGDDYKTIVIDTGGALIELMKEWAMRTEPSATKKNGGFSLQGYGVIKSEFLRLSAEIRKKYNVIFIFHAQKDKVDEEVFYDLVVEGATKTIVWQPCDLGAYMFIQNGKRYLGFTPTANYNAKSSFGISGLIEIPELAPGDKNDFLSKLFEVVRENIRKECEELAPQKDAYSTAMDTGRQLIECVNLPEDVTPCLDALGKLDHALTSEKELKALLKERMKDVGIAYNKNTKQYEAVTKE